MLSSFLAQYFQKMFIIDRFTCDSIVNHLILHILKTFLREKERMLLKRAV